MCGICGIATTHGSADVESLRAMAEKLVHRGPDSAGEHIDGGVALAARRLSIIDLAHGDQPIANEDGSCVVVQNGEIYNYPELRRELERAGHTHVVPSSVLTELASAAAIGMPMLVPVL